MSCRVSREDEEHNRKVEETMETAVRAAGWDDNWPEWRKREAIDQIREARNAAAWQRRPWER